MNAFPCLLELLGAVESFLADLLHGDLAESLLVFAGYENPDLAAVHAEDFADMIAAA